MLKTSPPAPLHQVERGVIVIGGLSSRKEQQEALNLVESLGWRTIADVTSGLRFLKHPLFDHSRDFSDFQSDCVLQIGGRLVSKQLNQWLSDRRGRAHLRVDPYGLREDPADSVTEWLDCFPRSGNANIAPGVSPGDHAVPVPVDPKGRLISQNSTVPLALNGAGNAPPRADARGYIHESALRTEKSDTAGGEIARIISALTDWTQWNLFLGPSLPVRDMDSFAVAGDTYPLVGSNRGASGIDGVISTACGFAMGTQKPLVVCLGDVTFLHDINGLSLLREITTPVIIIVSNNQGNGIFKMLPVSEQEQVFERYFLAPHKHDLSAACEVYGVEHQCSNSAPEFGQLFQAALSACDTTVIEARIRMGF